MRLIPFMKIKTCLACEKPLSGRSDKRFCDLHCKSTYHYKRGLERAPRFYNQVDNQLKTNRRLLKHYNRAGKAIIRASVIKAEGFNPNFFTHYWKNKKGDVYLFVYEYGFFKKSDNDIEKYVLIQWQEYMN